ncbi:dihydrofolate reductase [Rubidibacter lacunae KORDI 51-2]|uniref:Dihydrofolate reductase n=1 Tax=Rubidibacter lacunae KORDI 51-2 TaxID=582515 RepID=U5DMC2_9CHRO|nr:dihydrofolate reductase family protein [Rubidibacter lacunae]ERN40860.1 dihydrofolate reductase [Rubidibacter lacunae KORDI 51-2]
MKTIYYVAMSLDGFIADADESVDWLEQVSIDPEASDYDSFFAGVDGLLMGRKTFDFVYNYGQWPYGDKPTWVCSNREVPSIKGCNLQSQHGPLAAMQQAKQKGISTLWVVGGGQLASVLLETGQLTHLSISVMPILLGGGTPLVKFLPKHVYLSQMKSTPMSGFTQIEYQVFA